MRRARVLPVLMLLAAAFLSCRGGGAREEARREGPLRAVCTTTFVADLVRQVGGRDVEVVTIMGPGTDPHRYAPRREDARRLAEADIIFANGLGLEAGLTGALAKAARRRLVVSLGDSIHPTYLRPDPEAEGRFDPHFWWDPVLWERAGGIVMKSLARRDSAHAPAYDERFNLFAKAIAPVTDWARQELAAIPETRRVLVTAHEGFGYFARTHEWEAAAAQSATPERGGDERARRRALDLAVRRRPRALFAERESPARPCEELLAACRERGLTTQLAGPLWADALDAPDRPAGTYQGALGENVEMIVAALRGGTDD